MTTSRIDGPLAVQDAEAFVRRHFGLDGMARRLPGWAGQNFRVDCEDGRSYVLKVTTPDQNMGALEAQNAALIWLEERAPELRCPRVVCDTNGDRLVLLNRNGTTGAVRLLTFVDGTPLAALYQPSTGLLRETGVYLGRLDAALAGFSHPGLRRRHLWDLAGAPVVIAEHIGHVATRARAVLVRRFVSRAASPFVEGIMRVRTSVIHGDANDHNVLVAPDNPTRIATIIDFGDLAESKLVFDVAIAATYAMLNRDDPVSAGAAVVAGYHTINPLTTHELELIHACVVMRLCTSVCLSAFRSGADEGDAYLTVSEAPAWRLLEQLESISPHAFTEAVRSACEAEGSDDGADGTAMDVAAKRAAHIGPNLRLSYHSPLHIVRGSMQYLYDGDGREYLDSVNNVCHVGHSHPRVVAAVHSQFAKLNTNTRYLYRVLGDYAERLCARLPDGLDVCYLVNSGSEANDLALRLARANTGHRHVVVLDGAYHGNLSSLIDISPYKHSGPGGGGPPDWVRVADLPDTYRGAYRDPATAGGLYARDVQRCLTEIREGGNAPAAFFCESLPSCAGQVVLPPDYLRETFALVRNAGGICIADEVQVGFGRVGSAFWGFETQRVVPDIVTLGKPMGNGHPMGAVVTTRAIAESFDNGMEYFNSFGGNPVSCAAGLAVLDVIEDEDLQWNALEIGAHCKAGLQQLANVCPGVGDVRGEGLFLGAELVVDPASQEPAAHQAGLVVEGMKDRGILASRDGRYNNVIKIKPPLCFTRANADTYVEALAEMVKTVFP